MVPLRLCAFLWVLYATYMVYFITIVTDGKHKAVPQDVFEEAEQYAKVCAVYVCMCVCARACVCMHFCVHVCTLCVYVCVHVCESS